MFVYMPTWRDSQLELFTQGMDLNRLDAALGQRGDLMLLKPHANVHVVAQEYVKFANLIFVEGETDLYPLLPYTDVLITDYSSVLYDFILMEKKGVILYLYDYSQYVSMRDFYYPFDENVIGKRVYDFDSLLKAMDNEDCMLNDSERLPLGYDEHLKEWIMTPDPKWSMGDHKRRAQSRGERLYRVELN